MLRNWLNFEVFTLCSKFIHFVLDHDKERAFDFAPLQSAVGTEVLQKAGLPLDVSTMVLVDEAGGKGRRIGGAVISERHGNFLVNTGEASAEDVFTLIEETRARVVEHSGVELELEVKLWRRP